MKRQPTTIVARWCGVMVVLAAALALLPLPFLARVAGAWYGGVPNVWNTVYLTYQFAILLGAVYAHLLVRFYSPSTRAIWHSLLAAGGLLALLQMPLVPGSNWAPAGIDQPVTHLVQFVAAFAGLPLVVLSATVPLALAWQHAEGEGAGTVRWFALAAVGAFVAAVGYCMVIEPALSLRLQAALWRAGICLFALLTGVFVIVLRNSASGFVIRPVSQPEEGLREPEERSSGASWWQPLSWFMLPLFTSVMVLSITTSINQRIPAASFVWLLPLGSCLASQFLAFDSDAWYSRRWVGMGLLLSILATNRYLAQSGNPDVLGEMSSFYLMLFFTCLACYGELAKARPAVERLTLFYVVNAAGAFVGSVLVVVVCPAIFTSYLELNLAMLLAYLLGAFVLSSDPRLYGHHFGIGRRIAVLVAAAAGLVVVSMAHFAANREHRKTLAAERNFFGAVKVDVLPGAGLHEEGHFLFCDGMVHGFQFRYPDKSRLATFQHSSNSGVGRLLQGAPLDAPRRVAIIGMGIGALASYGREGDEFHFYEVNPSVIKLASPPYFSFLADSAARVTVTPGDGRLLLQLEPSKQDFDCLIVDISRGDFLPVHLVTREAFKEYVRHLKPQGVIAVNLESSHIDLEPVVAALAAEQKFACAFVKGTYEHAGHPLRSYWALASRNEELIRTLARRGDSGSVFGPKPAPNRAWSDDYAEVIRSLK